VVFPRGFFVLHRACGLFAAIFAWSQRQKNEEYGKGELTKVNGSLTIMML
jgi:hypothetical protein